MQDGVAMQESVGRHFGESIRCARVSESFGFNDVGSGVSSSDKEDDVNCSEHGEQQPWPAVWIRLC
jgi:hypothetical protein